MDNDKLDVIIELLKEIKIALEPETFVWKLRDKSLIETYFFNKLNSSQKLNYIKMMKDIATKNGLKTTEIETWPTDALRHLFYSSCKWVGIKDGKDKSRLSREIFEIISSKRGKLVADNKVEEISLFGDKGNVKLW